MSSIYLVLVVATLFTLMSILVMIANPNYLINEPTRDSLIESVDDRAYRAAALLAIIVSIFAISFVQSYGTSLSNTAIVLSAVFSSFTFVLSTVAKVRKILIRIQIEAFRFAVLLLFLSVYFLTQSVGISSNLGTLFYYLLLLIFFFYGAVFVIYIYITARDYNDVADMSRADWVRQWFSNRNSQD